MTSSTTSSFPEMRDEVARWGLDLRRGWEVYPTEIAGSRPADLVLEGTRGVLIEFPGRLARDRRPDRHRRRGGRRGRGGRSRAGARPPGALPGGRGRPRSGRPVRRARLAPLPQRPVARRRARRAPPSARPGPSSRRASSRSSPPTPTGPPGRRFSTARSGSSGSGSGRRRAAAVRRKGAALALSQPLRQQPQSTGGRPPRSSSAFAREKWRQPKKPLLAEYGEG